MKDSRTLKEIMDDTMDFQKTLELLTEQEKEKVKLFALGLMAGNEVHQKEIPA